MLKVIGLICHAATMPLLIAVPMLVICGVAVVRVVHNLHLPTLLPVLSWVFYKEVLIKGLVLGNTLNDEIICTFDACSIILSFHTPCEMI